MCLRSSSLFGVTKGKRQTNNNRSAKRGTPSETFLCSRNRMHGSSYKDLGSCCNRNDTLQKCQSGIQPTRKRIRIHAHDRLDNTPKNWFCFEKGGCTMALLDTMDRGTFIKTLMMEFVIKWLDFVIAAQISKFVNQALCLAFLHADIIFLHATLFRTCPSCQYFLRFRYKRTTGLRIKTS